MREWKVGELAKRTGLTVRALRHYDEIGLLLPSRRSPAGYRLYGEADVAQLHRIVSLKQFGWSLEEVRDYLSRPASSLGQVLRLQIQRLHERIEAERRLCDRLEAIAQRVDGAQAAKASNGAAGAGEVSADELLQSIEATIMFERYYTPVQQAQLEARRVELGEDEIKAVEAEWPALIERVKDCMTRGVEPASGEVRPLALRWRELVNQFTGGDASIAGSVMRMYEDEPSVRERAGLDPAVFEYVGRAIAANGGW